MKPSNHCLLIGCLVSLFVLISNEIVVTAQDNGQDGELLEKYISSKGYKSTIIFDASNIKQYWIDKTVLSKNNSIDILLDSPNNESVPLKIQLARVDQSLDCNVDIITNDPTASFLIMDQSNKKISSDNTNTLFIDTHIISSSFHLNEAKGFSFSIQFFSKQSKTLPIKKIILSFSNNKEFEILTSPGELRIGIDDVTTNSTTKTEKADGRFAFFATGVNTRIVSRKRIYVTDNELNSSIKIKNVGEATTRLYLGFAPYTIDGSEINDNVNLYKNKNKILNVLSHEKNSQKIIVDSYPEEWEKGCTLALNAKEDLSDFPNCNIVEGRIQAINKIDESQTEIVFNKPVKNAIPSGTAVRIQDKNGALFMYTVQKILRPGEETELSAMVRKDDDLLEFSATSFCRGTYYVVPTLMSYSKGSKEENKILISDYFISY